MHGVINLLKPPGMTSHDAVNYLRKQLKQRKIGHTGTLDPAACGVLPICIGKATRLAEYALQFDKCYRAEMLLGIVTDTQDMTGNILSIKDASDIKIEQIQKVIKMFLGKIKQTPPNFSAVKYKGKRFYELARKGEEIPKKIREVNIKSIEVFKFYPGKLHPRIILDIQCSKGTYIRTLCADIGQCLGGGGVLNFLIRTSTGPFDIRSTITLEALTNWKSEYLLPITMLAANLPHIEIDTADVKAISDGRFISIHNVNYLNNIPHNTNVKLMHENNLIAIGLFFLNKNNEIIIRPKKVLI
jgi:tRNA pseudouridine55 synthase